MKCFFHPENDAVGMCKSCSRGLCSDCAVEFPDGLACPGRCEELVPKLNSLLQKNAALSGSAGSQWARVAWIYLAMGLVMIWYGIDSSDRVVNLLTILGALFIFAGLAYVRQGRAVSNAGRDAA